MRSALVLFEKGKVRSFHATGLDQAFMDSVRQDLDPTVVSPPDVPTTTYFWKELVENMAVAVTCAAAVGAEGADGELNEACVDGLIHVFGEAN